MIPASWTPYVLSAARIVFGFLLLRHGLEQALGYPEASDSPAVSYQGVVEWLSVPAGLLLMLGLFTRRVALVFAVAYVVLAVVGPFQRGPFTHRNGADPILLSAFFFLYLASAGGGAWSLDRQRDPAREDALDHTWEPYALALVRVVAGLLFWMHGLEKFFALGGGRIDRDIMTMRGLAGWLENVGGPLIVLGLFTRPVAFILSGEMAVAYFRNWAPRGFWESFQEAGMEASILFCYFFLFLSSRGAGAWSVDTLLAAEGRRVRASVAPI
jgi:putative oxidoreductase